MKLAFLTTVKPWFENVEGEKQAVEVGKSVTLECSAQGFPLNVEWKVKKGEDSVVKACVGKLDYPQLPLKTVSNCASLLSFYEGFCVFDCMVFY